MSDRSTHLRRPFALGAALLVAAATFTGAMAMPVAAGQPLYFSLAPETAGVGDPITATSDVRCFGDGGDFPPTVEVTVLDDSDIEVFSTTGTVDDSYNWTAAIDTSGLEVGTYTVEARCVYDVDYFNNYQSESFTLMAAETTTSTSEVTATTSEGTTSTTETPTTDGPSTTVASSVDNTAAAAPAGAVASNPNYTG